MVVRPRVRGPQTLLRKLLLPLVLVIVFQTAVYITAIQVTGLVRQLEQEAYHLLNYQVVGRGNETQIYMNNVAENMQAIVDGVNEDLLQNLKDSGVEPLELDGNQQAIGSLLTESMRQIDYLLTLNNKLSGAFIMLNASVGNNGDSRACVYVRNSAPHLTVPSRHNLLMERGPAAIAREYNIPLDSSWTYEHQLSDEPRGDYFFTKPMDAARVITSGRVNMSYWSAPFTLQPNTPQIITYSMPLLDENGQPFGVFGGELLVSSFEEIIPSFEVSSMQGFHLLTDAQADIADASWVLPSGPLAGRFMDSSPSFVSDQFVQRVSVQRYALATGHGDVEATSFQLSIYGPNSMFVNEKWRLYGLAPRAQVLNMPNNVMRAVFLSLGLSSMLGVIALAFITAHATRPVAKLAQQVEGLDPNRRVRLSATNIVEIDELTDALSRFSERTVKAASRLSTIIDLVGMPIGGYEENHKDGRVFLTESLFRLLNIKPVEDDALFIPIERWREIVTQLQETSEPGFENVYCVKGDHVGAEQRWLRIEGRAEPDGALGVIIDVSEEVREKHRLEYERDYDVLTDLPNRRFFRVRAQEVLDSHPEKVGALLFCDMDNLKYVNDTYGHDAGDSYIKLMADTLSGFFEYGGVVSRLSGDEFVVLLHGFRSEEEVSAIINHVLSSNKNASLGLPDGTMQRLRFSTGITWYPRHTTSLDTMVRYADFAMYEVKHTNKGFVGEFNRESFESNFFLTDKQELLNQMLEERRIAFALQPIVDARTGEIFAFEALLRPRLQGLRTPLEVLRLANVQSKLYQLEHLVTYSILEWLAANLDQVGDRRIFYNSIASQMLSDDDTLELTEKYGHIMDHTVVEITESEQSSPDLMQRKVSSIRGQNAQIAIDDYGSGYSNEIILLLTSPEFIKIDRVIISDIDKDSNRQQIVQNTIAYARPRGIRIIAEGVETYDELAKLVELGVDLLQGYYFARPDFQIADIPAHIKQQIVELALAQKT